MPSSFGRRFDDLRSVFRSRAFALFSIGNFSSLTAMWVIRVCVAWMTWEQTQSKTWLGVMAFAELGPSVLISIWSGPLADRYDRVRILRWGQSSQALLALLLIALTATGKLNVWWMLAIMLGYSAMAGLTLPARLAVAPQLVARDQIATASAVGSIALNVTRLAGPIIAAAMLAAGLEPFAFALCTAGFALNAWCLSMIRAADRAAASAPTGASGTSFTYKEVILGVMRQPLLSVILVLQFVASLLLRPVTDMFPAFADLVFNRGEHGFAALTAAVGIGAIFGAGAMIGGSVIEGARRQILGGTLVLALSTLAFAAIGNFWLALVVLAVYGAATSASGIAATTFVQVKTPAEQLGRVMSIYGLIFRLAPALGALALGIAADRIGVSVAVGAFALASMVYLAVIWRKFNRLAAA